MIKPSKKEIFNDLRADYKYAKRAKSTIDKLITEWNDIYYAKKLGNEVKNRSQIVMKEIAKQIEWAKPNVMEPFTSTSMPVRLKSGMSESRAGKIEKYLNNEYAGKFDREEFMDQLTDVMYREGTAWVHTAWDREVSVEKERLRSVTLEEIMAREKDPEDIQANLDGTYDAYYLTEKVMSNSPTMEICRNEHIFPDPTARTEKELRFMCYERIVTIAELQKQGIKKEKLDSLWEQVQGQDDSSLANTRDADNRDYGQDQNFRTQDRARKKITVVEYWGFYDLDGDGRLEAIKASWSKHGNINFDIEENPMPSKKIPFKRSVYSARPFSLWGNALAYFLGDNQRVKSGLMRGILDNMSNSNNGQKFILRGALDYVNMKRMKNGEKYIVINKPDAVVDGAYNQLPNAVFQTMELTTQETEQLSGVSSGGPALNKGALSEDSEQQLTMSQQRMAGTVRNISSLISKSMKEWLQMAEVFLDDDQIRALYTGEEQVNMNLFKDMYKANCKLTVGTEVVKANRVKALNMLMQQAKVLGEQTPPDTLSALTAEMFELFDMPEKASQLRNYQPEPSPEQQAMQQMELQEKQMDLQAMQTKMQIDVMDAETRRMVAQKGLIDAQAGAGYKQAQSAEKMAKTQKTEMETALAPIDATIAVREAEDNAREKQTKGALD